MKQLIIKASQIKGNRTDLTGKQHHYLTRVRRLNKGDSLAVSTDSGDLYNAVITRITETACRLTLTPTFNEDQSDRLEPDMTLYQCLLKGTKFETVVRQAIECGVTTIVPIITSRTIPVLDKKNTPKKLERWNRIVTEALQQSGRAAGCKVSKPVNLRDIRLDAGQNGLFFHEKSLAKASLHMYLSNSPQRVALLTGPEGGLSPQETDLLIQKEFKPVHLGPGVLRAETAAVYALAAVRTILREKPSWKPDRKE